MKGGKADIAIPPSIYPTILFRKGHPSSQRSVPRPNTVLERFVSLVEKKSHRSRNIHLKTSPCEPGRLQKLKPASRRAWNTCSAETFADGSMSLMASTTSAVEKKWVASAGAEAGV